jgi:hypothetical protein
MRTKCTAFVVKSAGTHSVPTSRLSWVKKIAGQLSAPNLSLPNFVEICSVPSEMKHVDGQTEERKNESRRETARKEINVAKRKGKETEGDNGRKK